MTSIIYHRSTQRCTMICATILLCYLFTCCTHLSPTEATLLGAQNSPQHLMPPPNLISELEATTTTKVTRKLSSDGLHGVKKQKVNSNSNYNYEYNYKNYPDNGLKIEDLKHDNVHRLMSEQDLRRTFQVDSHDQVPEYEILKLTVNDDGSHLISPIKDLGELTTTTKTKTKTKTKTNLHPTITTTNISKSTKTYPTTTTTTTINNTTTTTTLNSTPTITKSPSELSSLSASLSADKNQKAAAGKTAQTSTVAASSARHKRSSSSSSSDSIKSNNFITSTPADAKVTKSKTTTSSLIEDSKIRRQATNGDASQLASDAYDDEKKSTLSHNNNDDDEQQHQVPEKLIVIKLSTFGKDFKLRLKRNIDFQQRIKDMKMFMAESTEDGQLRYTEIKNNNNNNNNNNNHPNQHKQNQHQKVASSTTTTQNNSQPESRSQSSQSQLHLEKLQSELQSSQQQTKQKQHKQNRQPELHKRSTGEDAAPSVAKSDKQQQVAPSQASLSFATTADHISGPSAAHKHQTSSSSNNNNNNMWKDIGFTYHDEDNLAALLIDHDKKTGRLQVDGTIGNDFVIKPMPRATIEALELKRTQAAQLLANASNQQQQAQVVTRINRSLPATETGNRSELERAIQHMHDDDPHDDDEMFLDEDEALELAHQSAGNRTSGDSSIKQQQAATISPRKVAGERKWRKYRKLMAQTQVPKLASLSSAAEEKQQRIRRHAPSQSKQEEKEEEDDVVPHHVSHHIVYRQRPSAEFSSSEHKHSFLGFPEQQVGAAEQLAASFGLSLAQGGSSAAAAAAGTGKLVRRSVDTDADSTDTNYRLVSDQQQQPNNNMIDSSADEDPLDGQFYLEPASITGSARAGYPDWSLVSQRRSLAFPPPYAYMNSSEPADDDEQYHSSSNSTRWTNNGTTSASSSGRGRRYKRQVPSVRLNAGAATAANRGSRKKRQAPEAVWPEVLLVVDYDSFLLHGGDSRDVKRYFVSFWNGVDLRYKLLVHPQIRISLAGMIVAKDRDATPYLERNRLRAPNADAVDAAGALTDMGKYLYREDRLPTYDLAVVITKLDMCRRRYEGGRCNRGTAGFAYVGGACVVNKRLEKVNSVAIIEDSGGFSGIIVAAHEVGHLLGCVHDGSPPPSYLGGPGATHCPWEDGFIMSDLRHTERGFRWSQCSVEQFKHFLNGETATCLYNYPHENQMLHRLLPGTMLSLDEQCKRDRGTNACFKDARVCAQLFCFDSASGYCVSYRPAAEGSPCGEGQVCRNGKCVGEIENIIPDYTHQSQTVVTRRAPHNVVPALADNGLSASSTSTATSSPDSKLPTVLVSAQKLSNRMGTIQRRRFLV